MVPSGVNVTIECPQRLQVNLHSNSGTVLVDSNGWLIIVGCDLLTVATRSIAANAGIVPAFADSYFGSSRGDVLLKNSRMLMPSEVRHALSSWRLLQPWLVCSLLDTVSQFQV